MTRFEQFKIILVLILGVGVNITAAMLLDKLFPERPVMMFMALTILAALAIIGVSAYLFSYIVEPEDNEDEDTYHIAYQSKH